MKKPIRYSETMVIIYEPTRRNIPEDLNLKYFQRLFGVCAYIRTGCHEHKARLEAGVRVSVIRSITYRELKLFAAICPAVYKHVMHCLASHHTYFFVDTNMIS